MTKKEDKELRKWILENRLSLWKEELKSHITWNQNPNQNQVARFKEIIAEYEVDLKQLQEKEVKDND